MTTAVVGMLCEPYATVDDLPEGCPCRVLSSGGDEPSDEELTELLQSASEVMWSLLAQPSFGPCERTIHPCRQGAGYAPSKELRRDALLYGACSCCGCAAVWLPGPVHDVLEVVVDGVTLDPGDYELHDGFALIRPEGSWPAGGGPASEENFKIVYEVGTAVPPLVRDATIELANDMWLSRCGSTDSRFSRKIRSLTTPGVSYSFDTDRVASEAADLARDEVDGLATVGKAIAAYNPTGAIMQTAVWSPDADYENRVIRTFS